MATTATTVRKRLRPGRYELLRSGKVLWVERDGAHWGFAPAHNPGAAVPIFSTLRAATDAATAWADATAVPAEVRARYAQTWEALARRYAA